MDNSEIFSGPFNFELAELDDCTCKIDNVRTKNAIPRTGRSTQDRLISFRSRSLQSIIFHNGYSTRFQACAVRLSNSFRTTIAAAVFKRDGRPYFDGRNVNDTIHRTTECVPNQNNDYDELFIRFTFS